MFCRQNAQFSHFAAFAQQQMTAGKAKAIARARTYHMELERAIHTGMVDGNDLEAVESHVLSRHAGA